MLVSNHVVQFIFFVNIPKKMYLMSGENTAFYIFEIHPNPSVAPCYMLAEMNISLLDPSYKLGEQNILIRNTIVKSMIINKRHIT